jgi:hypothetical protein
MTRTLFILAGVALLALVGFFIWGISTTAPGALIAALLCAMPLFFLALGAALGRASNEFSITRRAPSQQQRQRVMRAAEPLA